MDQEPPIDEKELVEEKANDVHTQTVDLTPSEDYDMSEVKSKPPPRKPVEPTYRGWKEVGHYEEADELTAEDEAIDLLSRGSFLESWLPAVAYGDWYHNVGFMVVGGLLSWIVGYFRFSLAPVFFIMIVSALMYRTSIRKYRQVLRSHAQREFAIKSIEDDYETIDWLNVFLEKFWHFLEPSVSQIVTDQANPILAASPIPAFVKALWLDCFTAGTKPPRIDMVKTLSGTADDVVVMDWGVSFTPNETADSSAKQLRSHVNQKVIVKVNLFGVEIPVAVSDVSFRVLLRVRLRMMSTFPHIETINATLLEPPSFDFNSRVLGDSIFNWEVLAFPGLYPFINEMVKKYVGPLLFTPLSFQLNVQQVMAGYALNSAVGVLEINIKSARNIKDFGRSRNTVDPYCEVGFFNRELAKTNFIHDTTSPTWNERLMIPVTSLSDPLIIAVWDYNFHRKANVIGSVQFDLEALRDKEKQNDIVAAVVRNNKPVGELKFDLHYMPALVPQRQADGAIVAAPDLNTGIAQLTIGQARNLKGADGKPISTTAEVFVNGETIEKSSLVKKNNSPSYGISKELIIHNRAKTRVKVVLRTDDKKLYGTINTTLNDLVDATQVENPWFQFKKGGEILIDTSWKPVRMEGASGAGGYTPPIGVVRVTIDKAEDLRNLETIGKVDPYVRMLVNSVERSRTAAVESTLNPSFAEVHYISVSSPNQKLTLEVMDVEKLSADRTLGSFDVNLSPLINRDDEGRYVENVDKSKRQAKLIHKKGPKGLLTYSLSFYPVLPVLTQSEIQEQEAEKKKAIEEKEKKEAKEKEDGELKALTGDEKKEKDVIEEDEEDEDEETASNKLKLSLDELVQYKSGLIVFELSEVETSKTDSYLQLYFDNHGIADFTSPKLRQKRTSLATTSDITIRDLDDSVAVIRLAKKADHNRCEKPIAETTISTLELLKNGFENPYNIHIEGGGTVKARISWLPIVYKNEIPPQDSKDNSGYLTATAVSAEGLPAGDRNGKSDPYVKLYLNTEKSAFFKSKKIKKTLDPQWNETSDEVAVYNKYDSVLRVEVFDWDVGPEQDDLLGIGEIKLSEMAKEGETEYDVPLTSEDDEDAGFAHFKLSFRPDFVLNVKPESASHIGDAFGTVGSGVGVVGNVGKGVGKGLGKGVGTVGKGIKKGLHLGR